MTVVSTLICEFRGKDVNLMPLITSLEARLKALEATGAKTGTGLGGPLTTGARQAGSSMLALQRAQAGLEVQQGNLVGAAERLRNALAQQTTTTTQTIGAQRQLAAIEAQLAQQTRALEAAQQRAAASALAHAQSQARLQAASGNTAAAIRTLQAALQGIDRASVGAIRAETQLIQLQQRLVKETAGGAAGTRSFGQSFLALAGPLGVATTGIGAFLAIASKVKAGFDLKASLDATTASINAQLKGVRDTNQVYAQANEFANTYKLTQRELTEGISASVGVMRSSKAGVEDILSVLARLQILSPEQSLQEAAFALKALAGGDTQSLVTRFEVSRDLATEMKNEIAAGGDAVQVVSAFLDNMGIGMDALKAKTEGATGATKDYAIAQEELSLALGRLAEGPGVKVLSFLTGFTTTLTNLASKGDAFAGAAAGADAIQAQLVGLATSYEDYGARLSAVNQQVRDELSKTDPVFAKLIGNINQLTPAQFQYAQSLIATGTAQGTAITQAQALGDFFQHLATIQTAAAASNQTTAASLAALNPQMAQVAALGPETAQGVLVMAAAVATNQLSVENFRAALAGLVGHHEAVAQATALDRIEQEQLNRSSVDATQAISAESTALAENTAKTLEGQIQAQRLAEFQATLANLAGAVASGHTSAGNAALALANKYNIARDAALGLINMQAQLAGTQVRAARQGGLSLSERREGRGELELLAQRNEQIKAAAAAAEAERRYQLAIGNTAPQLAHLRGELKKTREGSAEYYDVLTKIAQLEGRGGARGGGGGGGGGVKLSDQQKLNNQLIADQEKFSTKFEDLELKHGLKLLAIERSTNEKRKAAADAFQQARLDSDASFYRSIGDIQDNGLQQLASAQFEQALAESEEIGRTKGRDAAKAYLEARRAAILEDTKTQEEINKALAEGDTGRAEFLTGVQAKERAASAERLRQIQEEGSAIENERARQIADEERAFEESQGKIADQAETSAARRIAANERAGKAIDPERLAVQGLTADYEKLSRVSGRGATNATGATTAVPVAATASASPIEVPATPDLAALLTTWQAIGTEITKAIAATERAVRDGSSQVAGAVAGRAFS